MASSDPLATRSIRIPGTLVLDPTNPDHWALREQLPAWAAVAVDAAIGRDVVESRHLCIADWRLFSRLGHLRELLMRRRGQTIVVVGLGGEAVTADGIAELRRFAGKVLVLRGSGDAAWAGRLQVPVHQVDVPDLIPAIAAVAAAEPAPIGDVEAYLYEAQLFLQAGDAEGAFVAAARALTMAPDQPGIIADVARLLAKLGQPEQANELCRSYLLQRPSDERVTRALADLQACST